MKSFYFLFLVLFSGLAYGQKKQVVGFIPVTGDGLTLGKLQDNFMTRHLYNIVTTEFINSRRFTVIELSAFDLTKIEKERQTGEGSMYAEIKRQGKNLSADVLIFGSISVITHAKTNTGDYQVNASYSLKYIDVETGEIKYARLLDGKKSGTGNPIATEVINMAVKSNSTSNDQKTVLASTEKLINNAEPNLNLAIKGAFDATKDDIVKWVKSIFPVTMPLKNIQIGAESRNEDPNKYYITFDAGKEDGLSEKMKSVKLVLVSEDEALDGSKSVRDVELCKLKVESVQEKVTVCSVKIKDVDKVKAKGPESAPTTLMDRVKKEYKQMKGVEVPPSNILDDLGF